MAFHQKLKIIDLPEIITRVQCIYPVPEHLRLFILPSSSNSCCGSSKSAVTTLHSLVIIQQAASLTVSLALVSENKNLVNKRMLHIQK